MPTSKGVLEQVNALFYRCQERAMHKEVIVSSYSVMESCVKESRNQNLNIYSRNRNFENNPSPTHHKLLSPAYLWYYSYTYL
jgi:hypothetical protein